MQSIFFFGALVTTGLSLNLTPRLAPDHGWDSDHSLTLARNQVFVGMRSWHHGEKEDRKFAMWFADGGDQGLECAAGAWTGYTNNWDKPSDFTCPQDQALAGIFSTHDNHFEDRRFKFRCCDITSNGKYFTESVRQTGWLNNYDDNWDRKLDFKCKPTEVMVGLMSEHSNWHNDRRFKIKCALIGTTEEPTAMPTDVPTEMPTQMPTNMPTQVPTSDPTDATVCYSNGYRIANGKTVRIGKKKKKRKAMKNCFVQDLCEPDCHHLCVRTKKCEAWTLQRRKEGKAPYCYLWKKARGEVGFTFDNTVKNSRKYTSGLAEC